MVIFYVIYFINIDNLGICIGPLNRNGDSIPFLWMRVIHHI
jgi:hypothetical protein